MMDINYICVVSLVNHGNGRFQAQQLNPECPMEIYRDLREGDRVKLSVKADSVCMCVYVCVCVSK